MIPGKRNTLLPYLAIILGGSLLFMPFLGQVALFDWDEVNFAEIAREMIVTKDYLNVQIDYKPFWEKPPLFIWMQVLSMKLFGINEFAARFPNAICGIVTLLVIFSIGKKIYNEKMGLIWVLVYTGSILPFFYFKSGIIDPWFNLFIFLGIYFAVLFKFNRFAVDRTPVSSSPSLLIFLSGAAIGLAILTKGPVALIIFGITGSVYLLTLIFASHLPVSPSPGLPVSLSSRLPVRIKLIHILLFVAGMALTGGSWFLIMIANGNMDTVMDFIIYQARLFSTKDAGHGGFPGYHIVILMFGVFPASAFLFNGFKADADEKPLQKEWRRACIILLLTVVILFEIVQTKIVHYSSLAYFPLTYLSALAIYRVMEGKRRFSRLSLILLITFTVLWALFIVAFSAAGMYKEGLINSGLIKDPFAVANLGADVHWSGYEKYIACIILAGLTAFFIIKKTANRVVSLFTASLIFTFLTMIVFTEKIEGYTQRTVNEFYQQRSTEDCYIRTLGFKSYAHYFYGKTQPHENPLYYNNDWLLTGKIDKPAYFVYKLTKKDEYSRIYPHLNILYEKNGFIFAARYPEKPNPGL